MFSSNTSQVANGSILGVEDVFSTYLYTGNGSGQSIKNNIQLGGTPTNGTVLHLTGDTLNDSAPNPCGLINTGSVVVNTTTKKYGTGSLRIPSTTADLSAYSPDLQFGTGDFTIECWVYATTTDNQGVFQLGSDVWGGGSVFVSMYPANQFQWGWDNSYTGGVGTFSLNTWIHVALVRQGNTLKFYVNGTQTGSTNTYSGNVASGICKVGYYYASGQSLNGGYIDDLRVSNKAVYTSNFTPPAAALPIDTLISGSNYGGLVMSKMRSSAAGTVFIDSARGITKLLNSTSTVAESTTNAIGSFSSTGHSVIGNTSTVNANGYTYVSWTFRKQPKFFDVVTYTGNGVNTAGGGKTVSHNLGSVPGCIIVKQTDGAGDWKVYHRSNGSSYSMDLNKTAAREVASIWGGYDPTSTDFKVSGTGTNNISGGTYVAYLFAHDTGGFGTAGTDNVISCGSATCSGGIATINLGYEPQWVLAKVTNTTGDWRMLDNMRGWTNNSGGNQQGLQANTSAAEASYGWGDTISPTGFNLYGGASDTFIYIAIRRGPMKTPTSGTSVFLPTTYTGNGSTQTITTTIRPDFVLLNYITGGLSETFDRLRGNELLYTQANAAKDSSNQYISFANNTGFILPSSVFYTNASASSYTPEAFTRAPSVIDVVCYTGTGSVLNVSHGLTVAPEMMWVKRRDTTGAWSVYHKDVGNTKWANMSATSVPATSSNYWNNTTPTASVFTVGATGDVNASAGTYVAYLFATCPGVSKVGSYTGNGTNQTINCGFSSGARLIMIKRTDAVGSWYLWDSSRGIVSGNDPYIRLNDGAVSTTTDAVDADNSGFIVNQESLNLNVNAATYIFWAVA